MKINSKKTLLVLAAVALVGGTFTAVALTKENGFSVSAAEDENTIWKHYAAVAPTFTSHGSKEFWANCSEIGTHVFVRPSIGKIQEGDDFSKTAYFKELTAADDRYVAKLTPKVTFDSRGGTAIATQEFAYGTSNKDLPAATRAADDYRESYEFDGWYSDGLPVDAEGQIQGNLNLKAGWKYGKAKTTYVSNWAKSDFTVDEKTLVKTVTEATNITGFTKADDEGIIMYQNSGDALSSVTTPAINFNEILETKRAIYMEVGSWNTNNSLMVKTDKETKITANAGTEQEAKYLTRTFVWFAKESDGKVHMHFHDITFDTPLDGTCTDRLGDVTLTDEQANGTTGLTFVSGHVGWTRSYWLGRPYYVNGEEKYLDVSEKTGLTVDGGSLRRRGDTSGGAGAVGWWSEYIGGINEYVGIYGQNTGGPAVLTFDSINFNEVFAKGKGVEFTIGCWNGGEYIYFGKETMGRNDTAMEPNSARTVENITKTWHNWHVRIDDIGLHAYNKNEDKTYNFVLTEKQLSGEEKLTFQLTTNQSNARMFLLSNLYSYQM